MRITRSFAVVLMVAAALSTIPNQSAEALSACSGPQYYFQGYGRYYGATNMRGATANISEKATTACNTASTGSFSTAWAMLAHENGHGYAQIGYMRNDTKGGCGCERFFWSYNVDGSTTNNVAAIWGTPSINVYVPFRVDLQGDGYIHLFWDPDNDGDWHLPPDNSLKQHPKSNFQPSISWPDGQVPAFTDEITYVQSLYKGVASNQTDFQSLQMRDGSGIWDSTDLTSSFWQHFHDAPQGADAIQNDTRVLIWN